MAGIGKLNDAVEPTTACKPATPSGSGAKMTNPFGYVPGTKVAEIVSGSPAVTFAPLTGDVIVGGVVIATTWVVALTVLE